MRPWRLPAINVGLAVPSRAAHDAYGEGLPDGWPRGVIYAPDRALLRERRPLRLLGTGRRPTRLRAGPSTTPRAASLTLGMAGSGSAWRRDDDIGRRRFRNTDDHQGFRRLARIVARDEPAGDPAPFSWTLDHWIVHEHDVRCSRFAIRWCIFYPFALTAGDDRCVWSGTARDRRCVHIRLRVRQSACRTTSSTTMAHSPAEATSAAPRSASSASAVARSRRTASAPGRRSTTSRCTPVRSAAEHARAARPSEPPREALPKQSPRRRCPPSARRV